LRNEVNISYGTEQSLSYKLMVVYSTLKKIFIIKKTTDIPLDICTLNHLSFSYLYFKS